MWLLSLLFCRTFDPFVAGWFPPSPLFHPKCFCFHPITFILDKASKGTCCFLLLMQLLLILLMDPPTWKYFLVAVGPDFCCGLAVGGKVREKSGTVTLTWEQQRELGDGCRIRAGGLIDVWFEGCSWGALPWPDSFTCVNGEGRDRGAEQSFIALRVCEISQGLYTALTFVSSVFWEAFVLGPLC